MVPWPWVVPARPTQLLATSKLQRAVGPAQLQEPFTIPKERCDERCLLKRVPSVHSSETEMNCLVSTLKT